jgi:hypothetical protein
MAKGDNFDVLIADPKTGKLREASKETKSGNPVGPEQPKSLTRRAYDYATDPYAGTQGKGKEWAKDIQAAKERKTYAVGKEPSLGRDQNNEGRQPKARGE